MLTSVFSHGKLFTFVAIEKRITKQLVKYSDADWDQFLLTDPHITPSFKGNNKISEGIYDLAEEIQRTEVHLPTIHESVMTMVKLSNIASLTNMPAN